MKTLKITLLLIVFVLLSPMKSIAQNQMYVIHKDNVKPAMEAEYVKINMELIDACKKYNLQDTEWYTARISDGSYLYISPIANMAELDVNTFAPLADKMGKDNLSSIFERFNKCYDSHGNYIVTLMKNLSYVPEKPSTEVQNFRKYHFFYVTPSNSKAVAEKLSEIKDLFTKKGSKEYYRIYHSGFGVMNEYYVAVISAKDEMSYEKTSQENDPILGDEWKKKFNELYILSEGYEQKTGYMHPELDFKSQK